jgi:hypothetical protein
VRTLKTLLTGHGAVEATGGTLEGNAAPSTSSSVKHKLKKRYDPHDLFFGGNGEGGPAMQQQQRREIRSPPPKTKSPRAVYRL